MTEPEPSDIEITYKGAPAISASLAAKRWRTSTDTMRKTIARLKAAGQITALPEGLDERIELYRRDEIDLLVNVRPGRGANLRNPDVRPMAELAAEQQPAYRAAAGVFTPYPWPDEAKERAAREIATELWTVRKEQGPEAMRALIDEDGPWRFAVDGLVTSLHAQGAKVTPIPIGRAVRAVAELLAAP